MSAHSALCHEIVRSWLSAGPTSGDVILEGLESAVKFSNDTVET